MAEREYILPPSASILTKTLEIQAQNGITSELAKAFFSLQIRN